MGFSRRGALKTVLCGLLFAGATSISIGEARAADLPAHVAWGELLVNTVLPPKNEYGSGPSYIRWAGDIGYVASENRTVCGTFVTLLFQRAYGLTSSDFTAWMNTASPDAAAYHDAIAAENGFERITHVSDVLPGDLIAIKYPTGSEPSGHVAIVTEVPSRHKMVAPIIKATLQFEVFIIDSTNTPHGSSDSRVKADGSIDTGAGSGSMRLYTDPHGEIVGHAWSTGVTDGFYDQTSRHLVVGRLAREVPAVVDPAPGLPPLAPMIFP
jgi:hypothetical protein